MLKGDILPHKWMDTDDHIQGYSDTVKNMEHGHTAPYKALNTNCEGTPRDTSIPRKVYTARSTFGSI